MPDTWPGFVESKPPDQVWPGFKEESPPPPSSAPREAAAPPAASPLSTWKENMGKSLSAAGKAVGVAKGVGGEGLRLLAELAGIPAAASQLEATYQDIKGAPNAGERHLENLAANVPFSLLARRTPLGGAYQESLAKNDTSNLGQLGQDIGYDITPEKDVFSQAPLPVQKALNATGLRDLLSPVVGGQLAGTALEQLAYLGQGAGLKRLLPARGAIGEEVPHSAPEVGTNAPDLGTGVGEKPLVVFADHKPVNGAARQYVADMETQKPAMQSLSEATAQENAGKTLPFQKVVTSQEVPTEGSVAETGFFKPGELLGMEDKKPPYEPRPEGDPLTFDNWMAMQTGGIEKPSLLSRLKTVPSRLRKAFDTAAVPWIDLEADLGGPQGFPNTMREAVSTYAGGRFGRKSLAANQYFDSIFASKAVHDHPDEFSAYLGGMTDVARLKKAAEAVSPEEASRLRLGNMNLDEAQGMLDQLRAKVGPQVWSEFEKQGSVHQQAMRKALDPLVNSGVMTREAADTLTSSYDFYSPSKRVAYLQALADKPQELKTAGQAQTFLKSIVGADEETLGKQNPVLSSMQQVAHIQTIADKNVMMQRLASTAKRAGAGIFEETNPVAPAHKPGYSTLNWYEGGKLKAALIPDELAASAKNLTPSQMDAALSWMPLNKTFKAGVTTYSVAFQGRNIPSDTARAAIMHKAGFLGPSGRDYTDVVKLPMDMYRGFKAAILGNMGFKSADYAHAEEAGWIGSSFARDMSQGSFDPLALLHPRSPKTLIGHLSSGLDEGTKITFGLRGERMGLSPEKNAYETLTFAGTPNAALQGTATPTANQLYPFFGVRMRGAIDDLTRLAFQGDKKASALAWWRLSQLVALPTIGVTLYNRATDPTRSAEYERIPENDKRNWVIVMANQDNPDNWYADRNGEKRLMYYKVFPLKDITQIFSNAVNDSVDFAMKLDPKKLLDYADNMLNNVSPVNLSGRTLRERGETFMAGTAPVVKAGTELLFNRDLYFHRDLVPSWQRDAHFPGHLQGAQYASKDSQNLSNFLAHLGIEWSPAYTDQVAKDVTGNMLTQFTRRNAPEGMPKAASWPIARTVFPSGYTQDPLLPKVEAALDEAGADKAQKYQQAVTWANSVPAGTDPSLIKDMAESQFDDPQTQAIAKSLLTRVAEGKSAAEKKILTLGVQDGSRARFIKSYLNALPPAQASRLEDEWSTGPRPLISKKVARQMEELP